MKTTTSGQLTLVNNYNGSSQGFDLFVGAVVAVGFFLTNNSSTNLIQIDFTGGVNPQDGNLHSIAVTYDGSKTAAGTHLYVDGTVRLNNVRHDTLTGSSASATPVSFAAIPPSSIPYTGALGYVAIYNCVLTGTQVATFNGLGPGIN